MTLPINRETGNRIVNEAIRLFRNEQADLAARMLDDAISENGFQRLRRYRARLHMFYGELDKAKDLLQSMDGKMQIPGFWELALGGEGKTLAYKNPAHRILYVPIPKSGSTSVKTMLHMAEGHKNQPEDIYRWFDAQMRPLVLANLKTKFENWTNILVVRDPLERLNSFYQGNILKRETLKAEIDGRDSFYGLPAVPTLDEFIEKFDAYRRTFIHVRHHTEPITNYVGTDVSGFNLILNMRDVNKVAEKLSAITGRDVPPLHEMAGGNADLPDELQHLKDFYEQDYSALSDWF